MGCVLWERFKSLVLYNTFLSKQIGGKAKVNTKVGNFA